MNYALIMCFKKEFRGWGCSSVVEHSLGMLKALGSILNTAKTK
jgi:hypothetical protein